MTRPPQEIDRTDPFSGIPPEVCTRMRFLAPVLVEEALTDIHRRLGGALAAPKARSEAHRLLDIGVRGFMERLGTGRSPDETLLSHFRALGACEAGHGHGLERLHSGMRAITAAVWRVLSDDDTVSRDRLGLLGEAVLLFQEELGRAAAQGYAQAGSAGPDASPRHRSRLLGALLSGAGRDPSVVAGLARTACWRVPGHAAVVLFGSREAGGALPPSLPPDALVDTKCPEPCALVPEPGGSGRLRALERSLGDSYAVLGPSVPLEHVPESLERARELVGLVRSGAVPGRGLVRWDDHLLVLLLSRDTALLSAMSRARLAPLAGLRPHERERLAQTLLAWLETGFNASEAAERLHVHPQTVRYRMRRLEELFGARLRDPGERFELELVLRARRLPGTVEDP